MPTQELRDEFSRLYTIITTLRSEAGCPWDQRQTPASIKKYLLEEATELAEAIDRADADHICEEIGDLFYILILLMRMHEERGSFQALQVLTGISEKMIRRHPHVFAGAEVGSDEELREQWQRIKTREKQQNPARDLSQDHSARKTGHGDDDGGPHSDSGGRA